MRRFVIRRQRAPREQYDLRLDAGGMQRSWTIQKGPSLDPSHKRVATQVISAREASASGKSSRASRTVEGDATIWDQGTWESAQDPAAALDAGCLEFSIQGSKLLGRWELRRASSRSKDADARWYLTKQQDEFAIPGADVEAINEAFEQMARTRIPMPKFIPPALCSLADAPPGGAEWIHEMKLDGYRIEALIANGNVRLMSRNAKDWTDRFREIADALASLDVRGAILDGEIVAMNEKGAVSFQTLQQSMEHERGRTLRYVVFDLLMLDGESLLAEPLARRVARLEALLPKKSRRSIVQLVERFDAAKGDPLEQACASGHEGVVSKRIDSRYVAGRGRTWIKSKCGKRQEFVVVGFTDPQGSRLGFGSLLLAVTDAHGKLRYAGRVGTGFDTRLLDTIYAKLRRLEQKTNPLGMMPPGVPRASVHWVKPSLIAEVAFTEWTDDGSLRHPSFKGLREDKRPEDVRREDA